MASVFLSYDRDDARLARPIALRLEKAGHSVWWDLHVRGGAQFSKVIEEALRAANVVVVLWSARAIESPWVRDEAAAGRDSGRLVPVTLDGTEPPLGFRQFQTIDFSRWNGRGAPAELRTLLVDIEAMATSAPEAAGPAPASSAVTARTHSTRWRYMLSIAGALAIVAIGALYWAFAGRSVGATTVAVAAADPSTKPLARDLLINLGNLRSVQGGSVQLLGDASAEPSDLIFEASSLGAGKAGANLALMSGKDRAILWSNEFDQESGTSADLNLRMANVAGRVLGCAVEGLEPGRKGLRPQTLKRYLDGCSKAAETGYDGISSIVPIFEQVAREAPAFKPGWAKLLLAESGAVSTDDTPDRRKALQLYIAQARKLDPEMPEATLAQVTLLPTRAYGEILGLLDRAHASAPENTAVLAYRADALMRVGRMNDAISDAKEAMALDPNSINVINNYVLALAYAGRVDTARTELQRAERLWPGTGKLRDLKYAFELRFGDPKDLLNSEEYKQSPPIAQLYYQARADPTPAKIDRFMTSLDELHRRRGVRGEDVAGHAQAYGELHRENDLYQMIFQVPPSEDISAFADVAFRPALRKFRQDPRFMVVAKRIGLVDYWTKSGKWPDFCFLDPDQPYDCKAEAAKLK